MKFTLDRSVLTNQASTNLYLFMRQFQKTRFYVIRQVLTLYQRVPELKIMSVWVAGLLERL